MFPQIKARIDLAMQRIGEEMVVVYGDRHYWRALLWRIIQNVGARPGTD
jgi:hypothetical protein